MIPNFDPTTGIHYGVISQNSINSDVMSDIWNEARDLSYEYAKEELVKNIVSALEGDDSREAQEDALHHALNDLYYGEYRAQEREQAISEIIELWMETEHSVPVNDADKAAIWEIVSDRFGDTYEDNGDRSWLYEKDGYELSNCLINDVFVSKSPYFTYAPECSPCVPNAGNLDDRKIINDFTPPSYFRTYCLGHDFFDDSKAPYPVVSVETGKIVETSPETPCSP